MTRLYVGMGALSFGAAAWEACGLEIGELQNVFACVQRQTDGRTNPRTLLLLYCQAM